MSILFRTAQEVVILIARPYIRRELPGWGRFFGAVANYRRNWLWRDAPSKTIAAKNHGYLLYLDLSIWTDRFTFFLGRWYDLESQLLLKDLVRPGDTVVDVGANRGDFALCASHAVGPNGLVLCFEPNPRCQSSLSRTLELNGLTNIRIHPFGLSDRDENLVLSIPAINSGEATFGRSKYNDADQVLSEVKRGDPILADYVPSLVKIDVEGFEHNVVTGLAGMLQRHRPIVLMELIASHQIACGSSVEALTSLMRGLGYVGFKIRLQRRLGAHVYRHVYRLIALDEDIGDCDAIWVHREAIPEIIRSAIDPA
jgi:FkbM family methyltransferase